MFFECCSKRGVRFTYYLGDAIEARSRFRQNLIKMQNNEDPAICRLCITELV